MLQLEADLGPPDVVRLIEEKLGAGVWRCGASGRMQWSAGLYQLLGLDPHTTAPSYTELQRRIHPDDRAPGCDLAELVLDRHLLDGEFRIVRPNGALRWVRSFGEVLLDETGEQQSVFGVALDVTAHRRRLQGAKIDAERYAALVQLVGDLLWIGSSDRRVTSLPNVERRPDDYRLFGKDWIELFPEEEREAALKGWAESIEAGRPFDMKQRLRQADGTYRWHRCFAVPIDIVDSNAREWMGIFEDIQETLTTKRTGVSRLTGAQLRAARGLLNWSVKDLAIRTGISAPTIRRFEEFDGAVHAKEDTLDALVRALSEAGIELMFPSVGKPGVRPR